MDDCKLGNVDLYGTDHGYAYWKCGDVCTPYNAKCACGNKTLRYVDGWCCGSQCTRSICSQWKEKRTTVNGTFGKFGERYTEGDHPQSCAKWSQAVCTNGVALSLTQACNKTCNEHLHDKNRNAIFARSYISACTDSNTCIKEGEGSTDRNYKPTICTGDSSCEGELAWCKDKARKDEICLREGFKKSKWKFKMAFAIRRPTPPPP